MYKLVGCLVVVLVLVGCATEVAPDRPDTSPVTGVVTYNGEPVEGASVTFMTKSEGGRGATGTTDASGKFSLFTFVPGDGAIPGSYAVKVSKTSGGEMTQEEAMAKMETATGPEDFADDVKDLLPAKYKDENTSGLTADVNDGGDNNFTFELTD